MTSLAEGLEALKNQGLRAIELGDSLNQRPMRRCVNNFMHSRVSARRITCE
jgi:hypothetical protein